MDRREELRRKVEQIKREGAAKRERPPEQGEASAPSTEAASANTPPAPSLTPEQIREIARGEIEEALRTERAARQEESALTQARLDGLSREVTDSIDELSRELTDTNERLTETDERVNTLRDDTINSLDPMSQQIAELRSRLNSRVLPPAPEPRNVTPRRPWEPEPVIRPSWLKPGEAMPPPSLLRLMEPKPLRRSPREPEERDETSYKPRRPRVESSPPQSARTPETERPDPEFVKQVWTAIYIALLTMAVIVIVLFIFWALIHPWMAVAAFLAFVIILIWLGAIYALWSQQMRLLPILMLLTGAVAIYMMAS